MCGTDDPVTAGSPTRFSGEIVSFASFFVNNREN